MAWIHEWAATEQRFPLRWKQRSIIKSPFWILHCPICDIWATPWCLWRGFKVGISQFFFLTSCCCLFFCPMGPVVLFLENSSQVIFIRWTQPMGDNTSSVTSPWYYLAGIHGVTASWSQIKLRAIFPVLTLNRQQFLPHFTAKTIANMGRGVIRGGEEICSL